MRTLGLGARGIADQTQILNILLVRLDPWGKSRWDASDMWNLGVAGAWIVLVAGLFWASHWTIRVRCVVGSEVWSSWLPARNFGGVPGGDVQADGVLRLK